MSLPADSTVAQTTDGDAAVNAGTGTVAQGDSAVAGGDVYDDNATVSYDDSFNEDSNFTSGDDSPIVAADDEAEIEGIEFD